MAECGSEKEGDGLKWIGGRLIEPECGVLRSTITRRAFFTSELDVVAFSK